MEISSIESRLFETFMTLVQIDSPSGKEAQLGIYLEYWLKQSGFDYSQDMVAFLCPYGHS